MSRTFSRIGLLAFIAFWTVLALSGKETSREWRRYIGRSWGFARVWRVVVMVLTFPPWGGYLFWRRRRNRPRA